MTPTEMSRVLVLVTLALAVLLGCGPGLIESARLSSLDPGRTTIEYRFNDSSVAPEYHRSYTLIARSDEVSIVVDSYGDVLHEETSSIDEETWSRLVRAVADLDLTAPGDPDECTGGTSRDLLISEDDATPILDLHVAVCDEQGQTEAAVIEALVEPLLGLFDLETLLAPSD